MVWFGVGCVLFVLWFGVSLVSVSGWGDVAIQGSV